MHVLLRRPAALITQMEVPGSYVENTGQSCQAAHTVLLLFGFDLGSDSVSCAVLSAALAAVSLRDAHDVLCRWMSQLCARVCL